MRPFLNASTRAITSRGTRLAITDTTPSAAHGQHGQRQAVVARENRQIGAHDQFADLVERAGGFLDGHDRPDRGQPLDRLGLDVAAGPRGDVVENSGKSPHSAIAAKWRYNPS